MKKFILSLVLLTSGYALAMEKEYTKELIDVETGETTRITFAERSHWSDKKIVRKIHWQCKHHNTAEWYYKIWDNPDKITPELLDISYNLEKDSLKNPNLLEVDGGGIPLAGLTITQGSATIQLLNNTIVGYLKQLQDTPNTDLRYNQIITNIATLCSSRYIAMAPDYCKGFLVDKLTKAAQQHVAIQQILQDLNL